MFLFFAVNNVALLLRGPILVVLTSFVGLNYLVSNLISLGVLTIARFAIADSWIWAVAEVPDADGGREPVAPAEGHLGRMWGRRRMSTSIEPRPRRCRRSTRRRSGERLRRDQAPAAGSGVGLARGHRARATVSACGRSTTSGSTATKWSTRARPRRSRTRAI
jgi:hypothetical protein